MQTSQDTNNTAQPLTTANPQNIGSSSVFSQQGNLQSTANLNALSSGTQGIAINVGETNQSDAAYTQQQTAPAAKHIPASTLWWAGGGGLVLVILLWFIGWRVEKNRV